MRRLTAFNIAGSLIGGRNVTVARVQAIPLESAELGCLNRLLGRQLMCQLALQHDREILLAVHSRRLAWRM